VDCLRCNRVIEDGARGTSLTGHTLSGEPKKKPRRPVEFQLREGHSHSGFFGRPNFYQEPKNFADAVGDHEINAEITEKTKRGKCIHDSRGLSSVASTTIPGR
jgi:hypothetical protein